MQLWWCFFSSLSLAKPTLQVDIKIWKVYAFTSLTQPSEWESNVANFSANLLTRLYNTSQFWRVLSAAGIAYVLSSSASEGWWRGISFKASGHFFDYFVSLLSFKAEKKGGKKPGLQLNEVSQQNRKLSRKWFSSSCWRFRSPIKHHSLFNHKMRDVLVVPSSW